MLDRHPDIHPVLEQRNQILAGNLYAGLAGAAPGQHPPQPPPPALPPMYAPNFPGFLGLYLNHGHYAAPPQFQPPVVAPPPYYRERVDNLPAQPTAQRQAHEHCKFSAVPFILFYIYVGYL